MSSAHPEGATKYARQSDQPAEPSAILAALDDETCRQLLAAIADEPRTATELSSICDVPLSTTYRKLEQLLEASLVDESLRLSRDGRHANQYVQRFDDVTISIPAGSDIEVTVTQ